MKISKSRLRSIVRNVIKESEGETELSITLNDLDDTTEQKIDACLESLPSVYGQFRKQSNGLTSVRLQGVWHNLIKLLSLLETPSPAPAPAPAPAKLGKKITMVNDDGSPTSKYDI